MGCTSDGLLLLMHACSGNVTTDIITSCDRSHNRHHLLGDAQRCTALFWVNGTAASRCFKLSYAKHFPEEAIQWELISVASPDSLGSSFLHSMNKTIHFAHFNVWHSIQCTLTDWGLNYTYCRESASLESISIKMFFPVLALYCIFLFSFFFCYHRLTPQIIKIE